MLALFICLLTCLLTTLCYFQTHISTLCSTLCISFSSSFSAAVHWQACAPWFTSGVGARRARPARPAQAPALTDDITYCDWLYGGLTF